MARRQFDQAMNRLDYSQLLMPEPGFELDFAVGMTYSLDMEALLGIPVSLGMLEDMDSSAVVNPFFILEAIRKSSDKLAIFCNADGIKLPQNIRPVYALLENSLFPVNMGSKANFHPKLWVIRYISEDETQIKVLVLSRNLTFDRSMDIAVEMTGMIGTKYNSEHQPLADILSFVSGYAEGEKRKQIRALARDVLKVSEFSCGEQYESYRFLPFGIPRHKNRAEIEFSDAHSLIVVSPFLSEGVIECLTEAPRQLALITRKSSLTPFIFDRFKPSVYVPREELLDNALLEEADRHMEGKRDLHAKIIFQANDYGNFIYFGSLNASANAFYHNIEFMLELKYKPYYASYQMVLSDLVPDDACPFELVESVDPDVCETDDEESMDKLSDVIAVLESAKVTPSGEQYDITISGGIPDQPAEIAPLFRAKVFQPVSQRICFSGMLLKELSELYVIRRGDFSCLVKLPTEGIPLDERDKAIYNDVIGSKSGFLAYVAFLLTDNYTQAGIEQQGIVDLPQGSAEGQEAVIPSALYERLLHTAAYAPWKLEAVESIMQEIDPAFVDDKFRGLINTFIEAVGR